MQDFPIYTPPPALSSVSIILTEWWQYHAAIQVYKTLYKLSPLYLHDFFHYAADITSSAIRNAHCLFVPIVRTVIAKKQFYFHGHKSGTCLIPHFMQQGNWLILNCYINHFYVYNSCMFVRTMLKSSILILSSLPFKKYRKFLRHQKTLVKL